MFAELTGNSLKFLILTFLFLIPQTHVFSQLKCLSEDEVKKIVDNLKAPGNVVFNKQLQQEFLNSKADTVRIYQEMSRMTTDSGVLEERLRQQTEKNVTDFCQILRQYGWPSKALVGDVGDEFASAIFLNNPPLEIQQQLIPIMEAAFKAGEISKSNRAKMVDQSRVRAGKKQVFGTMIGVSKDLLLLYPIENEATVENLRRDYELPPLNEQIRHLEQAYQAVVIKPPSSFPLLVQTEREVKIAPTIPNSENDEVLKIDTNLVNLTATVLPGKPGTTVPPLSKTDFTIFENGVEQPIEYFAAAQVPFDITLLIDISGSTSNKNKLIRKTTRSFIKAARPVDRISIAVFDQDVTVIAPLTQDREKLLASVDKIKNGGGSKVWDALAFALKQTAESQNADSKLQDRRRAIVFMTDGADNSFVNDTDASSITFADLLEKVRQSSALIVPIHLDTREDYGLSQKLYYGTRRALNLLADESGGLFYEAKKISDLESVYSQVVDDLSKIYSIGYTPANIARNGQWRSLKVNLKNQPNLIVRSRKGYYAR